MEVRGLDCLLIWGDGAQWGRGSASLRYVSGIGANESTGICLFPLDGEPTVFVWHPAMALWWRRVLRWVSDVRGRSEHGWIPGIVDRLKELHLHNGRIGLLDFEDAQSYTVFSERERLVKSLPRAKFSDAGSIVSDLRMIKSAEELELLQEAGALVDEMFGAVLRTARVGARETHVYASIVNALIEGGGEYPEMVLWDAGPYPNLHPGRTPSNRTLKRGDVISIELHSKYAGYMGHGERCIFLGKPDRRYVKIHEVTRESYDSAFDLLRPGVDLRELSEAFFRPVRKSGMGVTELGIHGHGLSSGEFPTFLAFPFHYPGADKPVSFKLQKNMVFGVTVDLHDPKFKGGRTGIMLADTVQITSQGPKRLCKLSLDLLQIH